MIEELRISNFASINAELLFSSGFNVIVGETGAGKSLLLNAVSFLGGENRIPPSEGCFVEAVLRKGEEELILRREIQSGRSRYFLNGMRVPSKQVISTISTSVLFQSQRQSIKLLNPSYQLKVIDSLSEIDSEVNNYRRLYSDYVKLKEKLEKLKTKLMERERQIDILRFQIEEIESANLKEGEEENLLELRKVLSQKEKLKEVLQAAKELLYEGEFSALTQLGNFISQFERLEGIGEEILEKLNSIYYELESVYSEIESQLNVEEEEITLEEVENRLFEIEKLKRKYGKDYSEIMNFLQSAKEQLRLLENADFEFEKLKEEFSRTESKLEELSETISKKRREGAKKLKDMLQKCFNELNLGNAKFDVSFEKLNEFTPLGRDRVTFLFSGNPSLPLSPLSSSISGGELSRLLLCTLSIVSLPEVTMIFDEIDAGMSGKVLSSVASKLKRISTNQQVIAVTHSPQVVAAADKVFRVSKDEEGKVSVEELTKEEILEEIAIMIAGELTEGSINAARDIMSRWEE